MSAFGRWLFWCGIHCYGGTTLRGRCPHCEAEFTASCNGDD